MIINLLMTLIVLMNVLLLVPVLYFALGTKDKASKVGFGIMIFVYMADIIALMGGILA